MESASIAYNAPRGTNVALELKDAVLGVAMIVVIKSQLTVLIALMMQINRCASAVTQTTQIIGAERRKSTTEVK